MEEKREKPKYNLLDIPEYAGKKKYINTEEEKANSKFGKLVFTFDKIALIRGQVFRVYFYENGGARNLTLTLNINDINKAKRLN